MFRELQNAFSLSSPFGPPTDEHKQLVDLLAQEIVRRHLTTPALGVLEMSRPLNFLGAQAMHFFTPMMSALFDTRTYETFAKFLERRDAIDVIAERIEHYEKIATQQEANPS